MDRQNFIFTIIAIIVASVVAYFVFSYYDFTSMNKKTTTSSLKSSTEPNSYFVLVAAENLPKGKQTIKKDLIWQKWPSKAISSQLIFKETRNLNNFVDVILLKPLAKGEPITDDIVIRKNNFGYLSAFISPGKRAVSIPVTQVSGVAGYVFPGDKVDIICTRRQQNSESIESYTVLNNVLVLAIDQQTHRDKGEKSKIARTVTLEITPEEINKLATAGYDGQLTLALHSIRPK